MRSLKSHLCFLPLFNILLFAILYLFTVLTEQFLLTHIKQIAVGDLSGITMAHTKRNAVEQRDFPLVGHLSEELEEGDRRGYVHGSACMHVYIELACIMCLNFSWILTHSNVSCKNDFPCLA